MKTKKCLAISLLFFSFVSFGLFNASISPAQAATVKKATVVKASVTWAASGKKELAKIKNSAVRAAYKTKVEKYAIRKKIKSITSAVVKGMRE